MWTTQAIFAGPTTSSELNALHKILTFFGECSGLQINISETEIFPIRMEHNAVSQLLKNFPSKIYKFLGKYLGLPLLTQKLRKIEI